MSGTDARGAAVDEGGFEAFVAGRGAALLRFGYVLTGDAGLAEDLVQDALARTYRHWGRVVRGGHPEAYVRRAVVHGLTSWRRLLRNTERPAPEAVTRDAVVDDAADRVAERDLVWRAMAGLPPRQRAVLALRFYEDLPEAEIGALLGCSGGTVRSLTTRALHALRTHPDLARPVPARTPLPAGPAAGTDEEVGS